MTQEQTTRALTREDELLLSRYYDGECRWLERIKVRRLLASNPAAERYIDSLNEVGQQVCVYESSVLKDENGNSMKIDLWERIAGRIDQEERAALFLGERESRPAPRAPFGLDFSKVAWGLSGSALTAAVAIFMVGLPAAPQNQVAGVGVLPSSSRDDIPFRQVSSNQRPTILRDRRAIEVDWMRSDGRVHMFQDPMERAPIIWVKRNRIPVVTQKRFDRLDQTGEKSNRPVIIEERLPRSLTVAGPR
ncbi:MAG: hypothetical protein J5J00_03240 [Deltaproteobacteria bacterium]|nr:hypothetical protein [Deltaproteobacteria bacterium]